MFSLLIFFFIHSPVVGAVGPTSLELFPAPQLTCGSSVNETSYDHLEGIANREYHPTFMEPDVAMLFKKNDMEDIDLGVIESNLRRAIEEVSKWLQSVLQKWLIPYGHLNPIGKLIIGSVEQFLIDYRK